MTDSTAPAVPSWRDRAMATCPTCDGTGQRQRGDRSGDHAALSTDPVHQTIFNSQDTVGNCWQAAVASLLGLALDDVPHFMESDDPWGTYLGFLFDRGFAVITTAKPRPGAFGLATGDSQRGVKHAVVTCGSEMVHDPHPSGDGLLGVDTYEYFVPFGLLDRLGSGAG